MNKLQLIDADTLYYKPLAHPKMLIDGVLSDGLAILAGDSKIGKSWMVLWLCLQISRGEAVWGLPTRKTDVVYLALEDREWRVQQRMQELTDSPPENLRFGFSCGQLGAELEGQIEEALREFPSTGLIFIDTLQMVRDNLLHLPRGGCRVQKVWWSWRQVFIWKHISKIKFYFLHFAQPLTMNRLLC